MFEFYSFEIKSKQQYENKCIAIQWILNDVLMYFITFSKYI